MHIAAVLHDLIYASCADSSCAVSLPFAQLAAAVKAAAAPAVTALRALLRARLAIAPALSPVLFMPGPMN